MRGEKATSARSCLPFIIIHLKVWMEKYHGKMKDKVTFKQTRLAICKLFTPLLSKMILLLQKAHGLHISIVDNHFDDDKTFTSTFFCLF